MEFNVGNCLQHTICAHEGNALKELFFFFYLILLLLLSPHKLRSLLSGNCVFCKLL